MKRAKHQWVTRVLFISFLFFFCSLVLADDTCIFLEATGDMPINTFTAPVVPVARTTSSNRIYLAFFRPSDSNFWEGNVIKLGISASNEIVDVDGNFAILPDGTINENIEPFWSTITWADPMESNYILNSNRNIYTYLGFSKELTDSTNAFQSSNAALTAAILGNPVHTTAQIIDYIRGADVFDVDADGDSVENREVITGDVLHSEPLVVDYNDALAVVYFGSNDGMLHAVKDSSLSSPASDDGTELWAFIFPDQLAHLKDMIEGDAHQYFVDSSPKAYIKDVNGNGLIEIDVDSDGDGDVDDEDKDRVILVCGERKGGRSYVALDVTDPYTPVLMWRISPYDDADAGALELGTVTGTFEDDELLTGSSGGSAKVDGVLAGSLLRYHSRTASFAVGEMITGETSGATGTIVSITTYAPDVIIPELGESWSEPQFGLVKTTEDDLDEGTPVFFIGGGYSPDSSSGKAVIAINVFTGVVLKKFSNITGMNYSFPSSVTLVDGDSNGFVDKAYVGDIGGQMWRFGRFTDPEGNPLEFPIADENINNWEGQIIFLAGCGEANCVNAIDDNSNGVVDEWRKFFYPPSITLENGYDLVFMGTGDREDPCNTISSDRIYAVKDANTSVTVDESDLIDVTDSTATLPDLNFDQGWFIRLVAGEKVLAEGIVFNKTFYISTYSAIGSGGSATLYALQYKTGGTVGGYLSRQVWEGGGFLSRPVIVINETGQKLFASVGSDNSSGGPGPVSPGVLVIDPIAPPSNLFYLWWKEL